MLKYKDSILTLENQETITDAKFTLAVECDQDVGISVIIDLGEASICESAMQSNGIYYATFALPYDLIDLCSKAKAYLVVYNTSYNAHTNVVELSFDTDKIKKNAKKAYYTEVNELKMKIAQLQSELNDAVQGKIIQNIKIPNLDYVKKGMVLTSIDDCGTFVAMYPFANTVTKVNGVEAVNGGVDIDASLIEYKKGITIEEYLTMLAASVTSVNDYVKTIGESLKRVSDKLDELTVEFTRHVSSGII